MLNKLRSSGDDSSESQELRKKIDLKIVDSRKYQADHEVVLGAGNFGQVLLGRDPLNKSAVALKRVRIDHGEEDFPPNAVRELLALRILHHVNVVGLFGVDAYSGGLLLVLEYAPVDLFRVIELARDTDKLFGTDEIIAIAQMLLRGVDHCHELGIMHRDLKPSNLLLSHNGILKIADFGLARVFAPPNSMEMVVGHREFTHQVSTRWYRAPEILFGARKYSFPIDLWAVGVVLSELVLLFPPFQGASDIGQMDSIFKIFGTPSSSVWPEAKELPDYNKVSFTHCKGIGLENAFEWPEKAFFGLLKRFLVLDPNGRLTARRALQDGVFMSATAPDLHTESRIAARVQEAQAASQSSFVDW